MAASGAAAEGVTAQPEPRPAAFEEPQPLRVALIAALIVLLAGSVWFGYLDDADGHPSLKLGLALVLSVAGLGVVLVARLLREDRGDLAADVTITTVAFLSMAAALIHLAVVAQHFDEYWLYGWFFVVIGIAQLAWAAAVVVRPARWSFIAAAALNAAIAIVWVVSRNYGTIVGPDATEPARAGFGDIVSTALEVAIVVGIAFLLLRRAHEDGERTAAGDVLSGVIALGTVPLTVLAMYSAVAGHPFVSHVG